jgi:hypothetical protein
MPHPALHPTGSGACLDSNLPAASVGQQDLPRAPLRQPWGHSAAPAGPSC